MFGSAILWFALMFSVINAELKISVHGRYLLLFGGICAVAMIQDEERRPAVWFEGYSVERV
jgi:hypothetical protein